MRVDEVGGFSILGLCTGDRQEGYLPDDHSILRRCAARGDARRYIDSWLGADPAEVLYDELDLAGDRFGHRLLLDPHREFAIEFADVEVAAEPDDCR